MYDDKAMRVLGPDFVKLAVTVPRSTLGAPLGSNTGCPLAVNLRKMGFAVSVGGCMVDFWPHDCKAYGNTEGIIQGYIDTIGGKNYLDVFREARDKRCGKDIIVNIIVHKDILTTPYKKEMITDDND